MAPNYSSYHLAQLTKCLRQFEPERANGRNRRSAVDGPVRHGEDGPNRFIANGSAPQLPVSVHCLGPPGWLTQGESKGFSGDPRRKTCSRAVTASLDLRQRKPTNFRKPTGGVSK